ncbi:alpha-ketoglutarate-dependent dioxygenase AlkB [Rhodococcus aerolatus]
MFDTGQGSLLDLPGAAPAAGDPSALRRTELGGGAWVDLAPGWLTGAQEVHEALLRTVAWRSTRRRMYEREVDVPRLTAFVGVGEPLPHPVLEQVRGRLDRHYGEQGPFLTAGLNLYRDGTDAVAWHADRVAREPGAPDALVAILSLGCPRTLALRPGDGSGPVRRLQLGHGDLLVMGGSFQRTWQHAVPRSSRVVGPRVSVQLRSWAMPVAVAQPGTRTASSTAVEGSSSAAASARSSGRDHR